ncbi:hypothetical protein ACI2LC_11945 [Nonomuraea wenchangensis]|uniref:hypothetical protein n=1 Tax=Nonomuraea wenchangensis TaxID=568860 RepID=UPI0033F45F01
MALSVCDFDAVRATFPGWVCFRSDAGVFYGTRRGVRLSNRAIDLGLQQTVCADDLATFIERLHEQSMGVAT